MTEKYNKMLGLSSGGIVAWLLTATIDLGSSTIRSWFADISGEHHVSARGLYGLLDALSLYFIWGLPLAIGFVFLVGLPLWAVWEEKGRAGRYYWVLSGAIVGLALGVLVNLSFPLFSHALWSNEGGAFDSWNGGFQTYRNGYPTYFGIIFHILDVIGTILVGVVSGWVVSLFAKAKFSLKVLPEAES